jgi:ABC-type uncharacterized transport system auxiliary subunit
MPPPLPLTGRVRSARLQQALLLALLMLLGACASAPRIPETTYHRLPRPAPVAALAQPSPLPIVVQRLQADGLHADQALLYALDSDSHQLRAYHYNLWVDPPGYLLQRRLIGRLRAAQAAERVTDVMPPRLPALWLSGRIEQFERVPRAGGGWDGRLTLHLRLDPRDGRAALMDAEYSATVAAEDDSLGGSVTALGSALDQVVAAFLRELPTALAQLQAQTQARP